METVLVTGATGFLGYHVARHLNDIGVRPRVIELPDCRAEVLDRLNVERCSGSLGDPAAERAACTGAATVLHAAFKVSVGGGTKLLDEMRRINVTGTTRLLQTAAACGVKRAVVSGSSLAIGVNRKAEPIDESAEWSEHGLSLQYALMRREAELEALACATPTFRVMTVCPAFTFGPDDPVGAPANKLLERLISGKLHVTLPVGFGALDVRDFAAGMVLASERGRSGQRYLLSGENVTFDQLLQQAASIAGARAPRFTPPTLLLHALVGLVELFCGITGRSAPVTRDVLRILGRYAWYDTSKARAELEWTPRPLGATLEDTIRWLRQR